MNCNNLTKKEAQAAWHDSELKNRWEISPLDTWKRRDKYSAAFNETPFIKSTGRGSWIHDDFRGFATNGNYIIYVGDDWQGWWTFKNLNPIKYKSSPPATWSEFGKHYIDSELSEERQEFVRNYNGFGVPFMTDVTGQICKAKAPFMNWVNENPLEVKG